MQKTAIKCLLGLAGMMLLGITSCSPSSTPGTPIGQTGTAPAPSDSQKQQIVKMATGSSSAQVMKLLAKAYQSQDPATKIEFVSISQTGGAIAALKNNVVDVAGASGKPKAEDDDVKMQYRELARDLLVVGIHPGTQNVTGLTTDQLRAIYKGEILNWKDVGGPDAPIVVLDRPEDESAKKLLRKYYLGKDKTSEKVVILNKEGELIETLQSTPYAIGAFSFAALKIGKLPIVALSLNGAVPGSESFADGKYQMARNVGVAWSKSPTPATQKFIDFIFSPAGMQLLKENSFIPAG